jgi:hypothetical protein
MTKMENKETKKTLVFTESKSLRDETIDNVQYDF